MLPELVGLSWRNGRHLVPAVLVLAAVAALAGAWVVASLRRRRGLWLLLTGRAGAFGPDLVLVAVPLVAVLYLATSYTWWTAEPRYLYLAGPWLAWGLAALVADCPRPRAAAAVLLAVNVCLTLLGLHAAEAEGGQTWRSDLQTASSWLAEHGAKSVYADYRPAFTATFVTGGQEVVVPYDGQACRFPEMAHQADVLTGDSQVVGWLVSPAAPDQLAPALSSAGVIDRLTLPTVSAYLVQAPATPAALGLADGCR